MCALIALACTSWGWAHAGGNRRFDGERAFRDLVKQCSFGARVPGTTAHDACGEWLAEELRGCGAAVTVQRFTREVGGRSLPFANIEAVFNAKGDRHILLCAHWDSRPTADQDPDVGKRRQPVPGANDDASGVAALLEIARALKAHPPRTRVTIALFDGEDYGPTPSTMFIGSEHFAEHYRGPAFSWGVLLDMVGDRDLRIEKEQISLASAGDVVARIWRAAATVGATAFVDERGPAVMDDHVPLLRRGIACADVIDLDYPYWHTTADTPDKCSARSLAQVGRAVLQAIADFEAENTQRTAGSEVRQPQNGQ